jgi:hypothetical protein
VVQSLKLKEKDGRLILEGEKPQEEDYFWLKLFSIGNEIP